MKIVDAEESKKLEQKKEMDEKLETIFCALQDAGGKFVISIIIGEQCFTQFGAHNQMEVSWMIEQIQRTRLKEFFKVEG